MRVRASLVALSTLVFAGLVLSGAFLLCSCGPKDPDEGSVGRAVQVYKDIVENSGQKDMAIFGIRLAAKSESPQSEEILVNGVSAAMRDTSLAALKGLVNRPLPAAKEALLAAYEKKKGAPKVVAALALAKLNDQAAATWLQEQVSGGTVEPSLELLQYLVENGQEETVKKLLVGKVVSEYDEIRDGAYAMLGEIDRPWALQLLKEGFEKEHGARRAQAIIAFGRIGDPSMVKTIAKYVNTQGLVFASMEALGRIGDPGASRALNRAAKHDEKGVRAYAGAALWKIGEEESAKAVLEPLVADEDPKIRQSLATQLDGVKAEGAVEMLKILAADGEKDVRRAAFVTLMNAGGAELEPLFLEGAADSEYEVVTVALEALGKWGGRSALPTVEPLQDDPNPYTAVSAAAAVLEIIHRNPAGTP